MKKEKKKDQHIGEIERRTFVGEVRMDEGTEALAKRTVEGYAARFDEESELMWDFVEVISKGAFDDVLGDDVRALFNHDANLPLARNNGTLDIWVDEQGLGYRFEAPNTTAGNDLVENIRLQIVNQSSFGFTVGESVWEEIVNDDNSIKTIRHIKKIKALYDVSPVTYPAYTTTEVSLRSLENFKEEQQTEPIDQLPNLEMEMEILKLK